MMIDERLDLHLSEKQSADIARMVVDQFADLQRNRGELDDNLAAWWERYEARQPRRTLPFEQASNFRVPLTQWTVDGVWVRLMRTVAGQSPYLRIVDENLEAPPESTYIERMVDYLSVTDLDLRTMWKQSILNGLVEGTGVLKLLRRHETRRVRDLQPRDDGGMDLVERTVTDLYGLGLQCLDLKDCYVGNPAIVDVNEQPFLIHRVWLRWSDLVRRQRDKTYTITTEDLAAIKPLATKRRYPTGSALDQVKADLDKADSLGWGVVDEYEVLEWVGQYDVDDDGLDEECVFSVLANWSDKVLRARKYPFWNGRRNFFIYRPLPRTNRFYGRSLAGAMQALQDQVDTSQNQMFDANTLAILAALTPILPRVMQSEWRKHKWVLGAPIYTDAPEQFRTLGSIMESRIQLSTTEIGQILALAERTSGVTDPLMGRISPGDKTAYEIATVTTEGNVRFSEMVEDLQVTNTELGYQIIEHAYQLAQEDPLFAFRLYQAIGADPFQGARMADIRLRYAVRPVGNSVVANRDLEARKWLSLFNMFKQDPYVMADPSRGWYLRHKVLDAAGASKDADAIIGSEQEIEASKQMAQQAAMVAAPEIAAGLAEQGGLGGMMGGLGAPAGDGTASPSDQGFMGETSPAAIPGPNTARIVPGG